MTGAVAQQKAETADAAASDQALPGGANVLNVTASSRGHRWVDRLSDGDSAAATAIAQRHDLPIALGRLLASRGVGVDQVEGFLNPTLKALMPDPSRLQDMDRAAARIADAIQSKTPIGVFGDYDVDGACSSALWSRFLELHGVTCHVHIPDRLLEGYGPNAAALDGLMDRGAGLLLTVDCGTAGGKAFDGIAARGVDVIVIDHHQADETLPDVYSVVNPNRQDDLSGQGHLCAAGVVFLVLVAVTRALKQRGHYDGTNAPDLLTLLDLVALATVADVVPLKELNRAFVRKGLVVMQARANVGLRALCDAASLSEPPTPYHLGYILGPRINAGGRIGDAGLGARLLASNNETEAAKIAAQLDKLNRDRRDVERDVLDAAIAQADQQLEKDPDAAIVIVSDNTWHKGVVGLVASRLVERFDRPACVIAWEGAPDDDRVQGTGSLRSVAGVDIGLSVRRGVDSGVLVKGGGHAMAAGLTVARAKFDDLKTFLNAEVAAARDGKQPQPELFIDGVLTPGSANPRLVDVLDRAGPFGQDNPNPCFAFPSVIVRFAKVVGNAHVRCALQAGDGSRIDAIAFGAADQPLGDLLLQAGGFPVHIAGQVRRNTWGGREKIELQIMDAADPNPERRR